MEGLASLNPLTLATALGAGVISFASPCVLPLVPAYLGFITGHSAEELRSARGRTRVTVAAHGLSFVLGLAVIFTLLGASATVLGQTLGQNLPFLRILAGIVVFLFGLHMLGIVRIPLLYRTARVSDVAQHANRRYAGGFLMGLAFGAGWTPCIGPVLAGLLNLAATEKTVVQGVVLLLVYALGLGVPFLLAALAVDRSLRLMRALRPHLGTVEKVSGLLLIGMGILLFTDRLTLITGWMTKVFGNGLAL